VCEVWYRDGSARESGKQQAAQVPEVREHTDGETSLDFWRRQGEHDLDGIVSYRDVFSFITGPPARGPDVGCRAGMHAGQFHRASSPALNRRAD